MDTYYIGIFAESINIDTLVRAVGVIAADEYLTAKRASNIGNAFSDVAVSDYTPRFARKLMKNRREGVRAVTLGVRPDETFFSKSGRFVARDSAIASVT